MGAGFHSGFGNTRGAQEQTTDQETALLAELERKGVKFTKENVVFITKDKTGQIVWLETGTKATGMQHIMSRHADDFLKKHDVVKANIANHLKTVFQ